jgi:hypothetical protein
MLPAYLYSLLPGGPEYSFLSGTYLSTPLARETTNSYTMTSKAFEVFITHKPPHHSKILVYFSLK